MERCCPVEEMKAALKKRIAVAGKRLPADLVVKNGRIVNVFTGGIMEGDLAVADGVIAGIGSYEGRETVDAAGRWIIPGLIDGHVHIESSLLTPRQFSKILLQHGVTTAITDPHEMANVAGEDGIRYMLEDAAGLPMDIYLMLPSCVPATEFETGGARLAAAHMEPFLGHPRVLGLAEVMDFPSVRDGKDEMLDKLAMTLSGGGAIDGHAAGAGREDLNVYLSAGIRTDHEAVTVREALDRLELGMYLMIREGTAAKELEALLPAVTAANSRRCLLVTDDKLPDDLIEEGSVDHSIRLAVKKGLAPVTAVQMATLNAAECFGLHDRGAIAPGRLADFVLLDDLERVAIHQVYKNGVCVVNQGKLNEAAYSPIGCGTKIGHAAEVGNGAEIGNAAGIGKMGLPGLSVKPVAAEQLAIPLTSELCHVIGIIPNKLVTEHLQEAVDVRDGRFCPSIEKDQLKMAVLERHRGTGSMGLGIVKGFQLKKGAIAASISHDSHNLVVVGTTDQDMLDALQEIIRLGGGMAVTEGGRVLSSLALPVAGLMTDRPYEEAYRGMKELNKALRAIGAPDTFHPFLTLSFLTLPVIPQLKLTDRGLFDFASFAHIPVQVG